MAGKLNHQKKKFIKVFIEYGIHFWLLIFICNVAIFYAFRFFIMASTGLPVSENPAVSVTPELSISPTDVINQETSPSPVIPKGKLPTPTASPTPIGPVINLSFSLPGIGTSGGNLAPLHPVRDLKVYIYPSDSDSGDKKVKPLSTIQTKATYDNDPNSPTYTEFINPYIELGEIASKLDDFQVTFKTPQALMKLIKEEGSKSPGGRIFRGNKRYLADLTHQKVIGGDIYPPGNSDNVMDINDYNMLVNCFSSKAASKLCPNSAAADLDDNGTIDGVDYNLMLLSFRELLSLGYPIPTLGESNKIIINPTSAKIAEKIKEIINPTAKPTLKPTAKPTKIPVRASSGGNLGGLLIFFFILLIILGIGIFAAFKFHLLDKILKKTPKKADENNTPAEPVAPAPEVTAEKPVTTATEETPAVPETTQPTTIFSNTDQPADKPATAQTDQPANQPADQPVQEEPQKEPAEPIQQGSSGLIEKSGYLKKGVANDKGEGTWVTLADDSGITRALYVGKSIEDGFFKIKGIMKNDEENKPYIEITQADPED